MDYKIYNEISKAIIIPEEYGADEDEGWSYQASDINEDLNRAYPDYNFNVACGASKAVFISSALDYVIKTNFNGKYVYEPIWEENENGEAYECDGETVFEHFRTYDYSAHEDDLYAQAEEDGMEEIFLENICIDADKRIYLQEKCVTLYDREEKQKPSKRSREAADRYCEDKKYPFRYFSREWIATCFDWYGVDRTVELISYAKEVSGDYHTENYGYTKKDGRPVIFDYADFRD